MELVQALQGVSCRKDVGVLLAQRDKRKEKGALTGVTVVSCKKYKHLLFCFLIALSASAQFTSLPKAAFLVNLAASGQYNTTTPLLHCSAQFLLKN